MYNPTDLPNTRTFLVEISKEQLALIAQALKIVNVFAFSRAEVEEINSIVNMSEQLINMSDAELDAMAGDIQGFCL